MYVLKEETKRILENYKQTSVCRTIGINTVKLRAMILNNESCLKLTAYALSKFLNKDKEIEDYFIKIEK